MQPAEILYTETAETVCDACGPPRARGAGGPTWQAALERRRRAQQRRWIVSGLVFGWMVAGLFVTWRVHARLTRATIDAPAPLAVVSPLTWVRGRVLGESLRQPLWLVVQSPDGCPSDPFFAARVVARPDGRWDNLARFSGKPGQRFLLTIVAADELADAALERAAEDDGALARPVPVTSNADPCRPLPGGWLDLPAGGTALASRAVTLGDDQ